MIKFIILLEGRFHSVLQFTRAEIKSITTALPLGELDSLALCEKDGRRRSRLSRL